jgi:putative ABC transport system permease protein
MTALNRKLIRDLWHMRGMAAAIALVVVCGISTYVMSVSTLDSMTTTLEEFYRDYRFADVFANAKRTPESVKGRIEAIAGVDVVETRVVAAASIDIEGYNQPAQGQLISVPDDGDALLNQLFMVEGRTVRPYTDDEVVVSDAFAEAHGFVPGDNLRAIINGRRKQLTIVGIARSPEYIYQIAPGQIIPDFERFAILWMGRAPLATAFDMQGAFNDVTLTLSPGTDVDDVMERIDLVLARYGGLGSYAREDQNSHFYLMEEFRGLRVMATIFPIVFLGVAAFLLNIVINRLVQTQREQIAVLKAFGYSNRQIGIHFLLLVASVTLVGVAAGIVLGAMFGKWMSAIYMEFYRFPYLHYTLHPIIVVYSVGISAVAATTGAVFAVRKAAALPPAEAMRPEPPASFRQSLIERAGLQRWLTQPTRMIIRHLGRHPLKASLAVIGIALACALMLMGRFMTGVIDEVMNIQYNYAQRDDMTVTFFEPASRRSLYGLESLPGVRHGEPFRIVPVVLRNANHEYRLAIQGIEPDGDLFRLINTDLDVLDLPPEGMLIPAILGSILDVAPGDSVRVEVLEAGRPVRTIPIAGFIEQYIGVGAYMNIDALNRVLKEGSSISGAYLATDQDRITSVFDKMKEMPRVAGVTSKAQVLSDFRESMGQSMLAMAFVFVLFAAAISFAVIYNTARISLSERSRELASLRILGFTRGEIAYILLGELALLTLLAIPVGFAIGWGLCYYITVALQTELIRYPFVMTRNSYAVSALVIIVSALLSGIIVRRRLYRLNLISVLKTRE